MKRRNKSGTDQPLGKEFMNPSTITNTVIPGEKSPQVSEFACNKLFIKEVAEEKKDPEQPNRKTVTQWDPAPALRQRFSSLK